MPSAVIRINQATNPLPTGVAGRSRDDIIIAQQVQLSNADDTDVRSWRWRLVDQPNKAAPVVLANPTSPNPTFTPSTEGTYLIELSVNEGKKGQVQRRVAIVRDGSGYRVPSVAETDEANYLDGGVENPFGWWPDVVDLLNLVRTNALALNSRHVERVNFDHGVNTLAYIPFNSTTDSTTFTGSQHYWIAPRNGELRRAVVRCQSPAGSTVLRMVRVTTIGTVLGAVLASRTVNIAAANTPYIFDFTGLGATFLEGEVFVFDWDPTTQPDNVAMTIEFGLEA